MQFLRELLKLTEDKVVGKLPKARNKQLNDVLLSKKGGRHYNAKKDYKRSQEKQKIRKEQE